MAGNKKCLREWLLALIEGGTIEGLYWTDKDQRMFHMPWFHKKSCDWKPEHMRVFEEWERQTGRFRDGVGKPDYVLWKTRLRCALNKSNDFELVQKGSNDSFRIYKIVNIEDKKSSSHNRNKNQTTRRKEEQGSSEESPVATTSGASFIPAVVESENISLESDDVQYPHRSTANLAESSNYRLPDVVGNHPDEFSNHTDVLRNRSGIVNSFPDDLRNLPSADLVRLENGEQLMSIGKISIDETIDSNMGLLSDGISSLNFNNRNLQQGPFATVAVAATASANADNPAIVANAAIVPNAAIAANVVNVASANNVATIDSNAVAVATVNPALDSSDKVYQATSQRSLLEWWSASML